jgi:hypothetical protein
MMISIVVTAAGVIALKNTSPKEIRQLVRGKQQHMSP